MRAESPHESLHGEGVIIANGALGAPSFPNSLTCAAPFASNPEIISDLCCHEDWQCGLPDGQVLKEFGRCRFQSSKTFRCVRLSCEQHAPLRQATKPLSPRGDEPEAGLEVGQDMGVMSGG